MHWFSDMETVGTGGRITMFFCFVLFFLEQFWSGTSLLCHEERVSSESYYVPLQPPPPFCFNFFNTWTNKRLALIMGNPLAEQQWIHSGAPSVCVYYAMHIVPVLLDWVFSVPKLHSLGKRYRSTPHVVCVKAWPWKHAHTQKWEGKCKWARKTEILFLPCNQWLCKHTHTHKAACYQKLSHAALVQSSTPGWEDEEREGWTEVQRDGGSVFSSLDSLQG